MTCFAHNRSRTTCCRLAEKCAMTVGDKTYWGFFFGCSKTPTFQKVVSMETFAGEYMGVYNGGRSKSSIVWAFRENVPSKEGFECKRAQINSSCFDKRSNSSSKFAVVTVLGFFCKKHLVSRKFCWFYSSKAEQNCNFPLTTQNLLNREVQSLMQFCKYLN